ncbi:MAG: CinA family nicotinamide mononucleotide deamidase-related protein [Prosthecochloris sp.]|nr:CinA family nicotinamide mononucleotide deamidase-related protein [Prosthecochloris sp.]
MRAEIISIGDELLTGQKVNTNAAVICAELSGVGIAVERIIVCTDIEEAIIRQFADSLRRSELVLVTGGLGPTKDDRTRNAAAELLGASLVFHEETYRSSAERYRARGVEPSPGLRDNAMVIEGASVIANSRGLAPGMIIPAGSAFDHHYLVLMPGVPSEMEAMMQETVIPWCSGFSDQVIVHSHIMTSGVGETTVERKIAGIEESLPGGTSIAYLPHQAGVSLRVSSVGADRSGVERENRQVVDAICREAAEYIYATREATLEEVVGELLAAEGLTVATAESCTGGLVASRLTDVAGSSQYFQRGYVVYSNEAKQQVLGVGQEQLAAHGAVSEVVAAAMARGCLLESGADIAVSTTGIAGPGGGSSEKPVGMVCLGLARRDADGNVREVTSVFRSHGDRSRNKYRFSEACLRMLWQELT